MLQLFDNKYPYTDFHELNLDWIISKVIKLDFDLKNFVSLNTIKYASPIDWNITTQYETNTVVLDNYVAYLSTQPVPKGVDISNRDYWLPIADFSGVINYAEYLRDQIAVYHEPAYVATRNYNENDWLFIKDSYNNDLLYVTLTPILSGTGLVDGININKITVETIVKAYIQILEGRMGDLSDLDTQDNTSLVNAINSLKSEEDTKIGDLDDLTTSNNDSIVDSINSIMSERGSLSDLTTPVNTSIVNAINSVESQVAALKDRTYINVKDYGAVGDGITDDTAAINAAKAVAESKSGGACLYFPAGTYLISSTLAFTYKSNYTLGGVSIRGDSQYESIITSNSDIDLITYIGDDSIPNDDGHLFGINIVDIYLRYSGSDSTKTAISFVYCHMINMCRVRIRYFKTGVYLSHSPNSTFYAVGISANVEHARGFDVGDTSVSNAYIACFFACSGLAATLNADSVGFWADRGVIADQNIIYFDVGNATEAVHLNGTNNTTQQCGDINIINLVCETWYGITAYYIHNGIHGNLNIIGGWFNCKSTTPRSGIFLTACTGVNITGAVFVNNITDSSDVNGKTAIKFSTACSYININNCMIKNQIPFNASAGGFDINFSNNVIHIKCECADTLVYTTAARSHITNNTFAGKCLRYVRLGAGANYSVMSLNTANHQNTDAAGFVDQSTGSYVAGNVNNGYA